MLHTILSMYITLIPPILAGIFNMIWCKLNILTSLSAPIDFKKNFLDGKRIFGENKTWKGLFGYLFLNVVFSCIWGSICEAGNWNRYNYFYVNHDNTLYFNMLVGLLLGFGYALFELPNSFLKRRLDIKEGKSMTGFRKIWFVFLDQADSVIGCSLVVWIFYDLGVGRFLLYIVLGAGTHFVINMLLYFMKLRKNMF